MSENKEKTPEQDGRVYHPTLPRIVHIGLPIASLLVLVAFAFVLSLPPNTAPIPVQTTLYYIPIYVAAVIVLVFGSMYLFKAIMDSGY
jgi:hypothetical protein